MSNLELLSFFPLMGDPAYVVGIFCFSSFNFSIDHGLPSQRGSASTEPKPLSSAKILTAKVRGEKHRRKLGNAGRSSTSETFSAGTNRSQKLMMQAEQHDKSL